MVQSRNSHGYELMVSFLLEKLALSPVSMRIETARVRRYKEIGSINGMVHKIIENISRSTPSEGEAGGV